MTEQTMVVLGTFLTIGLSINAFFLKSLVEKLTKIELELVKFSTKHSALEKIVDTHENEIEALKSHQRVQ